MTKPTDNSFTVEANPACTVKVDFVPTGGCKEGFVLRIEDKEEFGGPVQEIYINFHILEACVEALGWAKEREASQQAWCLSAEFFEEMKTAEKK